MLRYLTINYCNIPNILSNSDISMPYANKVFVRSKSLNTVDYFPLKMFDYLASEK